MYEIVEVCTEKLPAENPEPNRAPSRGDGGRKFTTPDMALEP